jgi:hypothetical protein
MPAYSLVVDKNGPKLKASAEKTGHDAADDFDPLPPAPPNELELDREGYPVVPPGEGSWLVALRGGHARTHQFNASMQDLAALLSKQLSRPVTDATGLKGRYEFTLSWMAGVPAQDGPVADMGPDLLAAVQQQLVLVIDHLEKDPIENYGGRVAGGKVNDAARRERIREAAAYLEPRYMRGTGIVTSIYPLTSVFREMGLPLAKSSWATTACRGWRRYSGRNFFE